MLWFFKVKKAISWTKYSAENEAFAIRNGFGRLEKARCLGRIEAYGNVLRWLGIKDPNIERLRKSFKID